MTRLVRCLSSDVSERRDRCDPSLQTCGDPAPVPPASDRRRPSRVSVCCLAGQQRADTNGHIRNDTHDVSRRSSTACNSPICRRNCVADDRACTRVTPQNLHGKEAVPGSSPGGGLNTCKAALFQNYRVPPRFRRGLRIERKEAWKLPANRL